MSSAGSWGVTMPSRISQMAEASRPVWKSLWDLENELRSAARNAIFMRRDEAKQHMEQARRHYQNALRVIKGEPSSSGDQREVLPDLGHKPPFANRSDQ
jgi:hypothetical protein